jgi:hypothetical protein
MPIFCQNGGAEWPKRYFCAAQLDSLNFDDDLDIITIPAHSRRIKFETPEK